MDSSVSKSRGQRELNQAGDATQISRDDAPISGDATSQPPAPGRSWRFWAIFVALAFTSLLAAVESTVTSTAMPYISRALDAGELYVWFANAYTLAR